MKNMIYHFPLNLKVGLHRVRYLPKGKESEG